MNTEEILLLRQQINPINLDFDKNQLIEINLENKEDFFNPKIGLDVICAANGLGCLNYSNKPNDFDEFNLFYSTNYSCFYLKQIVPFLNPSSASNCAIGVNSADEVKKFAKMCLELNYINSIVFTSEIVPYIAPFGESFFAECWKNKIFTCTINPIILGLKEYSINEIKFSKEENKDITKAIFEGKIKNAPYATLLLNGALCLYITKKATSIFEGLQITQKTIENGNALEKFKQIEKFI